MRATKSTRVVGGIVGVQYLTSAVPGSPPAEALHAIQRSLGGPAGPMDGEPVPQLFFADLDGGSTGSDPQVVGLWVPIDDQRTVESSLRSAGFEVH